MTENDIIIEDLDVNVLNGDFDVFSAKEQNIKHLLFADKGTYLLAPTIGIGIRRFQGNPQNDYRILDSLIRTELTKDGYSDVRLTATALTGTNKSNLTIDCNRINSPKRQII